MNALFYCFYSLFLAVVCMFSNIIGLPAAEKVEAKQYEITGEGSCYVGDGRVSVHDPSVVKDKDGKYYVFGSHGSAAVSSDMIVWENLACGINDSNRMLVPEGSTLREALGEVLNWTDTYQLMHGYEEDKWETNVWAADVIYNEARGKYCYYGSSSVWGTPHSVIWFGTSDKAEGPYENIKGIVYSGFDRITRGAFVPRHSTHYSFTNIKSLLRSGKISLKDVNNAPWYGEDGIYNHTIYPNAIDPAVFYDKNGSVERIPATEGLLSQKAVGIFAQTSGLL